MWALMSQQSWCFLEELQCSPGPYIACLFISLMVFDFLKWEGGLGRVREGGREGGRGGGGGLGREGERESS